MSEARNVLRSTLSLVVGALVLSACATSSGSATTEVASEPPSLPPSATASEQPAPDETSATKESDNPPAEGAYIEYAAYADNADMYAKSNTVLFFAAPWCPTCRVADEALKEAKSASALPDGLAVVKVDYDSASELRQRYGVTIQHTFVHIDASGNEIDKWTGSLSPEEIQSRVS